MALPTIAPEQRKTEDAVKLAFSTAHPRILGALLDAAVVALRELPTVQLDYCSRLADFARWVTAGEQALGLPTGALTRALKINGETANLVALENSVVGAAMLSHFATVGTFQGTAAQLLVTLQGNPRFDSAQPRQKWSTNPQSLSTELRRLSPDLRKVGIKVRFERTPDKARNRLIIVETEPKTPAATVVPMPLGNFPPTPPILMSPALYPPNYSGVAGGAM